ncbi:MAG: DUF3047 domain-containing protein [Gemmatimonadota bacterium]|nr:DUF3047 domain-containing protein [Gemmatimonadota bacterium]
MMGLRSHTDFISIYLIHMVFRLCVLAVFVVDLRYSICFAADPDSTGVQPVVSVSVDSAAVDPAMADSSRSGHELSTTLKITDPSQPPAHWVTPAGDSTRVLETFDYPKFLNSYPDKIWEGRSGWRYSKTKKSDVYYRILQEDNNHYLNGKTKGGAVNFGREAKLTFRGREIKANVRLFQKLRWRWRVHDLPEGTDETDSDKNDSAAAVRLIFGTSILSGKSLKYIWSETLPTGTVIESNRQYTIVLRSGKDDLGKWVWEEVNAYQDYRRLFGGDPRPVDVLALLTDSNNTGTVVAADYDDIIFIIPRPTVEMNPENTE